MMLPPKTGVTTKLLCFNCSYETILTTKIICNFSKQTQATTLSRLENELSPVKRLLRRLLVRSPAIYGVWTRLLPPLEAHTP